MTADARDTDRAESGTVIVDQTDDRKKQICAAVLLLGLVIAVWTQPEREVPEPGDVVDMKLVSGRPDSLPPPSAPTPSAAPDPTAAKESTIKRQAELSEIRQLSRFQLSEIQRMELFAPEPAGRQVDSRRVQAVYATPSGHAAIVDESIVRSGEPLPGGVKILGISEQGVEVSR